MKSTSQNIALVLALLASSSLALQASVDSILNLDVKCYFQQKTSTSGASESGKVGMVRLDGKQLLSLLSKQLSISFSGGSQLKISTKGRVYVADAKGNVLGDVSAYFRAKLDDQDPLFDGSVNHVTLQEKSRNYFPVSFTIDLPALKGTITGVAIEDFAVGAANGDGVQIVTGNSNSMVNGTGSLDGGICCFDGKMNLKGREAIISK